MSKKSSKTSDIFKPKGKPPKGKARIHLIAAVYPNGAVGIARLEKGNSISDVAGDARSNAEDDVQGDNEDVIGDEDERDSNLAFFQVELVLTKPIPKPVQPKPAKAKATRLTDVKTGDEEPDNEGVVHPEGDEDDEEGDDEEDED